MPFAELAIRGSYSIRIESRTADAILGNLPFVGSTLAFCDGKKTAYVTLEYMAMDFSPDALRVWGILNLNGRRILLDIGGSCPPGTGESLQVGVKRLAFGSYALKEGYIPDMLAWLRSVLSEQEWIVPEPESGSLYLNLSGVLDSLGDFTPYKKAAATGFVTVRLQRPVLFRFLTLRILPGRQVRDRLAVGIPRIDAEGDEDLRIAGVIVAGLKDSPPFQVLYHHAPQHRQVQLVPVLIDQAHCVRRVHIATPLNIRPYRAR
jgi:hypothetical protein